MGDSTDTSTRSKVCNRCKESLPVTSFYKNKSRSDGLQNRCKPCIAESRNGKRRRDAEKNRKTAAEWRLQNPDRRNVTHARRRAAKRNAAIQLSERHRNEIKLIYAEAKRLTQETGIKHHVDHIVPLSGGLICGLHAPWNLRVIPAQENCRKSNSFDEWMARPACMEERV